MTTSSRRRFLGQAAIGATAVAVGANAQAGADDSERPPNVVLIISDDQHWGDYGFMGHPVIKTPNIDRLAEQSVVFTRGYVAAPLCCPSLAAMITGLHPHENKITGNDPPKTPAPKDRPAARWPAERLAMRETLISHIEKVPTIPRLLAEKGYASLQTGKWWQGHHSRGGFTDGMTHGDPKRGGRHGDAGLAIGRNGMKPIFDFIDKNKDRPFFVWYAPFLPHAPHNPPERLLAKYRDKTESVAVAKYWAMCEWLDETCGQLLDYLDEKKLSENTMVVYVCDNGWIQDPKRSGRAAPKSKLTWYDGGLRTPIMIRWPGHATPRRHNRIPVSSVDIAPTILRACGVNPPEEMTGTDLFDTRALIRRDTIFAARYGHDAVSLTDPDKNLTHRVVVSGEWKLVISQEDGKTSLFHITEDPHEETEVSHRHPDRVAELRAKLDKWYKPKG